MRVHTHPPAVANTSGKQNRTVIHQRERLAREARGQFYIPWSLKKSLPEAGRKLVIRRALANGHCVISVSQGTGGGSPRLRPSATFGFSFSCLPQWATDHSSLDLCVPGVRDQPTAIIQWKPQVCTPCAPLSL